MLGKKKCKMLREIRQKIANENDIPLVTEECKYKGDCKGTCPKCEAELKYLENQLEKRRALGKAVTVSAVALGLVSSLAGCKPVASGYLEGDVPYTENTEPANPTDETELILDGEIENMTEEPDTESPEYQVVGIMPYDP